MRLVICIASTALLGVLFTTTRAQAQTCTRFLNATEGDDRNDGLSRANQSTPPLRGPVRSFEHAFLTFPSGSVVCMTAGEYIYGRDEDGIQLEGAGAVDKNLQFVLESFAGRTTIAFTEDEFRVDIGSGRLTFQPSSASLLRMGEGGEFNTPSRNPSQTNFLHTIALVSGTVDASSVNLRIESPVGNPLYVHPTSGLSAPDAAIIQGIGALEAATPFTSEPRILKYVGPGNRSSGAEIPTSLLRLQFEHTSGLVTIDEPLLFQNGASIRHLGEGEVTITSPVTLISQGLPAIEMLGSGALHAIGPTTVEVDAENLSVIQNSGTGTITLGDLSIRPAAIAATDLSTVIANSGAGSIHLGAVKTPPSSSGRVVLLRISNQASGGVQIGSAATASTVAAGIENLGSGLLRIVGNTILDGSLHNRGELLLDGAIELSGSINNQGVTVLHSDVRISGELSNEGTVQLGLHTLEITSSGAHTNMGVIAAAGPEGGSLRLSGNVALIGEGILPSLVSGNGVQTVSAASIRGDVTAESGAQLEISRVDSISGDVVLSGGLLRLPQTTIVGQLLVEEGLLELRGDVVLLSDFRQMSSGIVDLIGRSLELRADFERSSGAFLSKGGTLVFSGPGIQTLRPGPDLVLDHLRIEEARVVLRDGDISVTGSAFVSEGSEFVLNDFQLQLVGQASSITNHGEIAGSLAGGLRFVGSRGARHRMAGEGLYGNVVIDFRSEYDFVEAIGPTIRQSGILTIERGEIRVAEGSRYILGNENGTPFLRRNLGDSNLDGSSDGMPISANAPGRGTFETPETGYSLEYYGTIGGRSIPGAEFISGRIVDVGLTIEGRGTLPAVLEIVSDLSFSGSLKVFEDAVLDLSGHDLRSTGQGVTHAIFGTVVASGGAFVIDGSSILRGDSSRTDSYVETISVESNGNVGIVDFQSIPGELAVRSGTTTLNLKSNGGRLGTLLIAGGQLNLASSIQITDSLVASAGGISTGDSDITIAAGAVVKLPAAGNVSWTGAGQLIFAGSATLETGSVQIPRILVAAGEGRVVFTNNVQVGEHFVHESGIVDLQDHDLIFRGGSWDYRSGEYTGPGRIVVSGSLDVNLSRELRIPDLTIETAGDADVARISSTDSVRWPVTIAGDLRIIRGILDLGHHDVILKNGSLLYSGGEIRAAVEDDFTSDANGELILSNATLMLDMQLSIPNLRVIDTSRLDASSHPLRVTHHLNFSDGFLIFANPAQVVLADGARMIRGGSGSFSIFPNLEGIVDVVYHLPLPIPGGILKSGIELSAVPIRALVIDAGVNTVELQSPVLVRELLQIRSGALAPARHAVTLETGTTVHLDYSQSTPPAFLGSGYLARGPIHLVFSGSTSDFMSDDLSFPQHFEIDTLSIRMRNGTSFLLHTNRVVDNILVQSDDSSGFDLNGKTLRVNENLTVSRGRLVSEIEAILDVGRNFTTLPETMVDGIILATVQGDTEVGGAFEAFLLRAFGNVSVTGRMGGGGDVDPTVTADAVHPRIPNVRFVGFNQIFRFANQDEDSLSIDDSVNFLTIDLADSTGVVRFEATDGVHTLAVNHLVLENGILATGANDIRLPHDGPGYSHSEDAVSHVAGAVSRRLQAGQPNESDLTAGRFDFPLGSLQPYRLYRPVHIVFSQQRPVLTSTILKVESADSPPGGYLGLPIGSGESLIIGDASDFYWTLSASPRLPASQEFDLGVLANGFSSFTAVRNLRLIERPAVEPSAAEWTLFGSENQYDNALIGVGGKAAPFVQGVDVSGGIAARPQIIAVGIEETRLPFARVQFLNLLSETGSLIAEVNDAVVAEGLLAGKGSPYIRTTPGQNVLRFRRGEAVLVADSVNLLAGEDYLAMVVPSNSGRSFLLLSGANATPALDEKDDVSLAFANAVAGAAPLGLDSRDTGALLFEPLIFGSISNTYLPVPSTDLGFNVVSTSGAEGSFRADFSGQNGLTMVAVASGSPANVGLTFINSHGEVLPSRVQVAAEENAELPEAFALHGNYPNPFNPSTTVVFDLPEAAEVTVEVYDLLGRQLMSTRGGAIAAGSRRALRIDGSGLASGMYLYRVVAEGASKVHMASGTMTLVK